METVGKSKISLETRRRYAESALARLTAEQLEERRKRDAARSAARREAQRSLSAPSARAMMTPEQLKALRERQAEHSRRYRRRQAGLEVPPTSTQLKKIQQGHISQSAPRTIPSPPTFEEIAKADAKLPRGFLGTIEMHPFYKNSPYAFPLRAEEIAAENLERIAMHPTGKRVQHYMMPSAEKKQRTEGGKKTKKAVQKKK